MFGRKILSVVVVVAAVCALMAGSCSPSDCCYRQCANTSENRYVVVSSKKGHGFGNRVRALASAHALATLTGRKLVLDWEVVPNEMPASFNQLFKDKLLTLDDVEFPMGWTKEDLYNSAKVDDSVVSRYRFIFKQDNENYSDIVCSCAKIVHVESYFRFLPRNWSFEDLRPVYVDFLRRLQPTDEIRSAVNDFAKKNFTGEKEDIVGVHFRSFKLTSDIYIPVTGADDRLQMMLDAMKDEISRNPNVKFFVATDHQPSLKFMDSTFPGRILSRDMAAERTTVAGQVSALVDWYLLAKTYKVLGTTESSFSDEAALLTATGIKLNIGPGYF